MPGYDHTPLPPLPRVQFRNYIVAVVRRCRSRQNDRRPPPDQFRAGNDLLPNLRAAADRAELVSILHCRIFMFVLD